MENFPKNNPLEKESIKFNSPQEELDFLKEQIKKKEEEIDNDPIQKEKEFIQKTINQYAETEPKEILTQSHEITPKEIGEIILNLEPRKSDDKINELLGLVAH